VSTSTDLAFRRALDPAPSSIERGAAARLHWRTGLGIDSDLRAVATDGALSPEWSAVLAETHARLLDPAGVRPLATPSPIGAAVGKALENDPSWAGLVAAASLHPYVARETVRDLAPLVRSAVVGADAAKLDSRRTLESLQDARKRLAEARARADAAKAAGDADGHVEALKDAVEASDAEQVAAGAYQQASAAADQVGQRIAKQGAALASLLAASTQVADGLAAVMSCGLGHALGAHSAADVPSEIVEALTPDVVALLQLIGALRSALREGRSTRHLPGREGMLGPDVGGLDRVGDARPLTLASLAGHLGEALRSLTLLQLVQGRAAVVEKGGGKANDGHVVLVLDQSGSMQGARALWANALALAIVLEAAQQNRAAVVVAFAETVRGTVVVDGPTGLREAFALCCRESDGAGTNVAAALVAAREGLARLPMAGRAADVVLATDGEWGLAALAGWPTGETAPRLQAVCIGGDVPAGAEAVLDAVWHVDASADVKGGGGLAVSIARTVV
jgi:hypothetical protein